LALHVAVSIATGGQVFGQFEVKQKCSVLYLDLEMSKNSVHRRLSSMNFGDWPRNLYFGFNQDWPNRGILAGQDLENRLDNNPDIRVVIIDVLAQWREPVDPRTPVYSSDYDALKQIQRIAQRRNIVIIVVHHTNKTKITKDDNPFDKISGSTGISGAVDAMWLLTRDPESEYASILRMTDRNIAGVDRVDLAWDDMLGSHVVDPKSKLLAATGPERRAVYDVMDKNPSYTWSPKEIATELGREESVIKKHLRRLLEDKLVIRVGYGRYSAVSLTNIVHSGNSSTSGNSGNSIHSSVRVNDNAIESEQELPRVNKSESRVNDEFEAIESIKQGKSEQSERISINALFAQRILQALGGMMLSASAIATRTQINAEVCQRQLHAMTEEGMLRYEPTIQRYGKK
jgi:ribosomal protein S25